MVEYLRKWLGASAEVPPIPRGIFAGAQRFLNLTLEGIALNRHERFQPEIPIMAGMSSMTIALGVLHRLPSPLSNLKQVEDQIRNYLGCLAALEAKQPPPEDMRDRVSSLKEFFHRLMEQGTRARHAAHARAEMPQT
jgi:hypothetical protein